MNHVLPAHSLDAQTHPSVSGFHEGRCIKHHIRASFYGRDDGLLVAVEILDIGGDTVATFAQLFEGHRVVRHAHVVAQLSRALSIKMSLYMINLILNLNAAFVYKGRPQRSRISKGVWQCQKLGSSEWNCLWGSTCTIKIYWDQS